MDVTVNDSNRARLNDGDCVILITDLKVKGMVLKTGFLKKA